VTARGGQPDDIRVLPDAEALSREAAAALTDLLAGLTRARRGVSGPVDIAVAGGFVSSGVLALVDAGDGHAAPDWRRVRVWWADERYVPAGDPDRNDADAWRRLFSRTDGVDLRRMPSSDGDRPLHEAAAAYLGQWRAQMTGRHLDLAVLGMGPDGHVASLFPGHGQLDAVDDVLAEDDSPKPPPLRITLSRGVLASARRIWVVAAGTAKSGALQRALGGADPHEIPAAALRGPRTTWWLDREAARRLRRSRTS
jgi:6-phosphogluconolactonase